jgi:putative FmdB family regulatory protein
MPTYEFRCPNGHEFNRFYKTMSTALKELPCPQCNEIAARQLSAGAGLVFKGSGFYLTDYGKNAHRADGGTPTGDAGEKAASKAASEATAKADSASSSPKSADSGNQSDSGSKAESQKPKAESREPKAESPKPKAETSKPKKEA